MARSNGRNRSGGWGRGAGFTLVELLVVIGIIALLISILLPSLNLVRRQARTVACGSNLRQIGLAMQMYCGDNKGVFPPVCDATWAGGDYSNTWIWPFFIAKYVGQGKNQGGFIEPGANVPVLPIDKSVFACPSFLANESGHLGITSTADNFNILGGYGMSTMLPPKDVQNNPTGSGFTDAYGVFHAWGDYYKFLYTGRASISQVRQTARIVLVADGSGALSNGALGTASDYTSNDWKTSPQGHYSTDYTRHNAREPIGAPGNYNSGGGLNVLFCDGHVTFQSRSFAEPLIATDKFLNQTNN